MKLLKYLAVCIVYCILSDTIDAQYLYFRHNSYIPVPSFQTTFDNNTNYVFSAGTDIKSLNVKVFKILNDKFLFAWHGNAGIRNQYSTELAIGKINMFGHNRFALLAGTGVGSTDNTTIWYKDAQIEIEDKWESSYKYMYKVDAFYYKLFLQPSYGFNFYNTVYFSVDLKLNMNYFTEYNYNFIVDVWKDRFYNENLESDYAYFENQWGLNIEPSASVYTKRIDIINFFAQMGFSYSFPVVKEIYTHPMHKYVFVNAGVNFIIKNSQADQ